MKYTKAFFIKLAMTIVVLWIVLGLFFGASFGNILLIGTILTIVAFVGDVFILPNVGNFMAAAGDLVLAFFGVWALGTILFGESIAVLSAAFLSALFVAVGELYFHRYYRDHVMGVVDDPKPASYGRNYTASNLQTEFSQEFDEGLDKKSNNDVTNSEDEGPVK
ncbi:YndM family protein [Ureibacillus chungkukjangi]|uniref:Uncharacterized protein DUF2512 n=1 Tax=Ureibacillus chungkukjangi TaxID=1202712 RepID=A0A318TX43_9BACL|nr:YndM family protein [Ureibacillus chungkukjangi]PYF08317.1 uncharacterized protein DUF2512 [Ureibacillus chungkukjangi]